jgi:ethanolamine utilization protein EutQ
MSEIVHVKKNSLEFSPFGGDENEGKAWLARVVDGDLSKTIGAGILHLNGCDISWTLRYDEVCVVLSGNFLLHVGSDLLSAGPGDIIWIPKNTKVSYSGEDAEVFYALYPVDWSTRATDA